MISLSGKPKFYEAYTTRLCDLLGSWTGSLKPQGVKMTLVAMIRKTIFKERGIHAKFLSGFSWIWYS